MDEIRRQSENRLSGGHLGKPQQSLAAVRRQPRHRLEHLRDPGLHHPNGVAGMVDVVVTWRVVPTNSPAITSISSTARATPSTESTRRVFSASRFLTAINDPPHGTGHAAQPADGRGGHRDHPIDVRGADPGTK